MRGKSYLWRKLKALEKLILEDWQYKYGDLPEEIRQQVDILRQIVNEVEERRL